MRRITIIWLGSAIIISGVFLTIYVAVQQDWRQSANLPALQLAEHTIGQLQSGKAPAELTTEKTDFRADLTPFVIIYDTNHQFVTASGAVAGKIPTVPPGVFSHVSAGHQNRFTWQTDGGDRFASVLAPVVQSGQITGYVLAGENLREVEAQENRLSLATGLAWMASIVVMTLTLSLAAIKRKSA